MSAPEKVTTRLPLRADESLFGTEAAPPPMPTRSTPPVDFVAVRDSPEFQELRRRILRFVVPATVLFLGNYLLFVMLSAYAPEFMATPAIGLVNVGILIGVFQFVTTVAIVSVYASFARNQVDPLADRIRDEVEGP